MSRVLVCLKLRNGDQIQVLTQPDVTGPFEQAALRLTGQKWADKGGEVVGAHLPYTNRNQPIHEMPEPKRGEHG